MPGIEICTSSDGRALARHRPGQPRDEIPVDRVGRPATAILQHADAVDDDVRLQPRLGCRRIEIDEGGNSPCRSNAGLLCRRELPGDGGHPVAPVAEPQDERLPDQTGGAENGDRRRLAHPAGFAIISQRIASTDPKPGMPKANHQRNRVK